MPVIVITARCYHYCWEKYLLLRVTNVLNEKLNLCYTLPVCAIVISEIIFLISNYNSKEHGNPSVDSSNYLAILILIP